jgi:tRNA (cmo5U34)-methyltransferase
VSNFSDPAAVARYAESPVRQVPGFHALQRMTELLLAERVPDDGRVLVVGAGGGLELKVFADAHAGWRYCGVDPSAEMLDLAKRTLGNHGPRVDFHHGYVETAPQGPFDAATCLLTLHFIPEAERLRTLKDIHHRLKPGAPLIVAHHSVPQGEGEKLKWLARYAAFAIASGAPLASAESAIATINERLPILTPDHDEALLRKAGFTDVALFYAAFTFRGWVATRT